MIYQSHRDIYQSHRDTKQCPVVAQPLNPLSMLHHVMSCWFMDWDPPVHSVQVWPEVKSDLFLDLCLNECSRSWCRVHNPRFQTRYKMLGHQATYVSLLRYIMPGIRLCTSCSHLGQPLRKSSTSNPCGVHACVDMSCSVFVTSNHVECLRNTSQLMTTRNEARSSKLCSSAAGFWKLPDRSARYR